MGRLAHVNIHVTRGSVGGLIIEDAFALSLLSSQMSLSFLNRFFLFDATKKYPAVPSFAFTLLGAVKCKEQLFID